MVSLGQDGQISSQGTLSEALKLNKALIKEAKTEEAGVAKADETIDDILPEIPEGKGGKLIVEEEITVGHVSWSASMSSLLPVDNDTESLYFSSDVHRWSGRILACTLLDRCYCMFVFGENRSRGCRSFQPPYSKL